MSHKISTTLYKKRYLALIALPLIVIIILGGMYFYKSNEKIIRTEKESELDAICDLKIAQIVGWKTERAADMKYLSQTRSIRIEFERWINNKSDKLTFNDITERLKLTKENHNYADIQILSLKGKVLYSFTQEKTLDIFLDAFVQQSISEKGIVFTDLYFCKEHNTIHYDILSPLINDKNEVFAIILSRLDPYDFLYPLIQSWPTSSKSAETYILRKEGDYVLYLSDLRHQDSSALKLKYSLMEKGIPAVQAALGYVGIFEGNDYRGIEVLSDLKKIPNTNWFMVAKVDKDEIFREVKFVFWMITIFVIVVILMVVSGLAFLYNLRQKGIYKELYNAEKKFYRTQEIFKTTLYSIGDAVITTDLKSLVMHVNPVAEKLTGWKEKNAIGKPISEIFKIVNEETNEVVQSPVEIVLTKRLIVGLANHTILISKDGTETPIADSGAPIKNEDGEITGVVLVFRDQTEERENRKRIEESESKYRSLFTAMNEGIALHELVFNKSIEPVDYKILDMNKKYGEFHGLKKEEVIGRKATEIYQSDIAPYLDLYSKVALTGKSESFETYYEPMQKYFDISVYSPQKGKFATVFQDITDKKKSKEKFEHQYYTLNGINESLKNAIFSVDTKYRYTSFNTTHSKIMKSLNGAEIEIGKSFLDYLREDKKTVKESFDRVLNGESFIVESYSGDVEKNRLYFQISHNPILNDDGKVIGVAVFTNDLTDWKKTEAALRSSEFKYKYLFKNNPQPMWVYDIDTLMFLEANDAATNKYGFTRDEFLRMSIKDIRSNEDIDVLFSDEEDRTNILYNERVWKHKKKNGEILFVEIISHKIEFDGKDARIVIAHDITVRQKAEDELHASEQRFSKAFNSNSSAMAITSLNDGKMLNINDSYQKLMGYSLDDFKGRSIKEFNVYENNSMRQKIVDELKDRGFIKDKVMKLRAKSGEMKSVIISLEKLELDGEVCILSTINDITGREKGERIKELQYNIANSVVNSRNLHELFETISKELSSLIDTSNFFAALYDEETDMFYTPFEKGREDAIDKWKAEKSLTGIVVKEKKSLLLSKEDIKKLAGEGRIELIGARAESWLGVPLKVGQKVLGAIVIQDYTKKNAYDINSIEVLEMIAHELSLYIERKKAEDVVNRLSKGIEQSPVCIVVTDINGNIEYINPKFTEVTGFTLKEAIGKNPHILKHGEYNEELSKNIWDTIKAGKDWKGDFYNKKKNGEYYWEAAIISPIFDDDNNITNYIAISEDITEKKNMINDLVKAKESAEEMNRLKSSFLANMSHELRTPLNGILGFADILKNDLQDQESRDMAQIIFKSGKRLHNTLNQILDLTTLHAEIAKVMKDNINVNNVVIESFNLYKAEALKKNLELKYEASTDNIFLFTDKNILLSTLNNLVDNAIKYTHEGNVAIKLFEEGENVVIEVVDTGIGIEKSNQELIFDEFRQVSEGYGRSFEGTGLGLSICKKYMKLIDGSLKLRSELYKGSTFRIELPKVVGQIRLELNSSSKKSGENNIPEYTFVPRKYNEKILYVENDKDCQSLLLKVFNDYVHIDIANDAMEGINKAKENDYAIILMDINLGSGLNGKDVTRLLRKIQKYKDIPIIAITAFAMEGDKQEFIDCGCTHYLSKPFEVNKMQDLIFGLLDKK